MGASIPIRWHGGPTLSRDSLATKIVNGVLVACALYVVFTLARREYFQPASGRPAPTVPQEVAGWQDLSASGHRIGPPDARVVVVEFGDFECPACARFERSALRPMVAKYSSDVAFVFRHWPLSYHRFAYPAARAAECAADQGKFQEFRHVMYSGQDSLGLKGWRKFAEDAGVADLDAFDECNGRSSPVPTVELDAKAALSTKAVGTPAILVNEMLLPGVPDSAQLDSLISSALRKPRKGE